MKELARTAPRGGDYRVYLTGGGTPVSLGWRRSSIEVDLFSDRDQVFRDIQGIKERLNMNIEFARPEDFVPPSMGPLLDDGSRTQGRSRDIPDCVHAGPADLLRPGIQPSFLARGTVQGFSAPLTSS